MPLSLASVRKQRHPVTINVGTEEEPQELKLYFNPRIYSPDYVAELQEIERNSKGKDEIDFTWAEMLSRLIVEWDLVFGEEDAEDGLCTPEEVGTPYPLTPESLRKLPISVLSLISAGIQEESSMGKKPGTPSGGANTESLSSLAENEGPLFQKVDSSGQPVT